MKTETTIKEALDAYDAFISAEPCTPAQVEMAKRVALAASFGSAAYELGIDANQGAHSMVRSTLLALIDPMHPDLDYLRAEKKA